MAWRVEGTLDPNDSRIRRAYELWGSLDEAILASGLDEMLADRPWESSHPRIRTAWATLTSPEHLADLEVWLGTFDNGGRMTEHARKLALKAIEVCRARGAAGGQRAAGQS
jgi:hypothetical protein